MNLLCYVLVSNRLPLHALFMFAWHIAERAFFLHGAPRTLFCFLFAWCVSSVCLRRELCLHGARFCVARFFARTVFAGATPSERPNWETGGTARELVGWGQKRPKLGGSRLRTTSFAKPWQSSEELPFRYWRKYMHIKLNIKGIPSHPITKCLLS
jgi:hypothetical protein